MSSSTKKSSNTSTTTTNSSSHRRSILPNSIHRKHILPLFQQQDDHNDSDDSSSIDYDQLILERYKIWRKYLPTTYDFMATHILDWPACSVEVLHHLPNSSSSSSSSNTNNTWLNYDMVVATGCYSNENQHEDSLVIFGIHMPTSSNELTSVTMEKLAQFSDFDSVLTSMTTHPVYSNIIASRTRHGTCYIVDMYKQEYSRIPSSVATNNTDDHCGNDDEEGSSSSSIGNMDHNNKVKRLRNSHSKATSSSSNNHNNNTSKKDDSTTTNTTTPSYGHGLSFSPSNSDYLIGGDDHGTVTLWNIQQHVQKNGITSTIRNTNNSTTTTTLDAIQQFHIPNNNSSSNHNKFPVSYVQFHPTRTNEFISSSDDGSIHLFDIRSNSTSSITQAHGMNVGVNVVTYQSSVVPDSHLFLSGSGTGCEKPEVKLWDDRKLDLPITTFIHGGFDWIQDNQIYQIRWHPNHANIFSVASGDASIRIFDINSTTTTTTNSSSSSSNSNANNSNICTNPVFLHAGHTDIVNDLDWDANHPNVLVSVSDDNILHVFQPEFVC
jgi:WD40 repeat protein